MAKQSTLCCGEEGRTLEGRKKKRAAFSETRTLEGRKKKRAAFSETELDAARQLVQLSGNSDERDGSTKKEKEEEDGTEASSAFQDVALLFGENEDDPLMRRNRRYRSIQHIYKSTKPIVDAVHAKKDEM